MTSREEIGIHNEEKSRDSETTRTYERYSGVCDVYNPEEARAMADVLRRERKNPNRKVMIGVMTHPHVLNPEIDDPAEARKFFPVREELARGFTDDPDVLNTIHYADLYGSRGPRKAQEAPNVLNNLELCVKYGGEHLHAIQLDVTWPDPNEIKRFKEKNPNIFIILQVGKSAFKEVGNDPQKLVDRLREYGWIDFALLDMSMGRGESMKSEELLPYLRLIKKELPYLGLAVSGGLGPDSENLLEFKLIAKEFPGISTDAQGNVKRKDAPRDKLGHFVSTHPADLARSTEYLQQNCALLDNPPEE